MTTAPTPFELDMAAQPAALQAFAAEPPPGLTALAEERWDRIVFTGMGSSLYAALPSWRALAALGHPVWNLDAGTLLDSRELLTENTLLVATSQSGGSGEVVQLLDELRRAPTMRPRRIVGVTANESSALATGADVVIPLRSGDEATVSTKSYLNTLAAHRSLVGAFRGEDAAAVAAEISAASAVAEAALAIDGVDRVAAHALSDDAPRIVTIGKRNGVATARYASLIVKESAKIQIEGYAAGQFRHGPYELSGPGLTAFFFGSVADEPGSLRALALDAAETGARIVTVGGPALPGCGALGELGSASPVPALHGLVAESVVAQLLALRLAEANGVEPGAFVFGSKVTAKL